MPPDTSSEVRTVGAGATEDPGVGRSGVTVVVVARGDMVTGSRKDGLGPDGPSGPLDMGGYILVRFVFLFLFLFFSYCFSVLLNSGFL